MFEKEAEEYLDTENKYLIEDNEGSIINIAKKVKRVYQDGAEFAFNKANEWHYPSKGEYPECDENTLLMIYVTCYYEVCGSSVTRNHTVLGYYQNSFMNDDDVKVFVEKK